MTKNNERRYDRKDWRLYQRMCRLQSRATILKERRLQMDIDRGFLHKDYWLTYRLEGGNHKPLECQHCLKIYGKEYILHFFSPERSEGRD